MEQIVRKMVKTGYGLSLLTLSQAKKIAYQAKKELGLDEEECLKLARALVANSGNASKAVLKTAGKYAEGALLKSGVVGRGELRVAKRAVKKGVQRVKKKLKR